jgi:hypothetical protein
VVEEIATPDFFQQEALAGKVKKSSIVPGNAIGTVEAKAEVEVCFNGLYD